MKLPPGITYHARSEALIAKDASAFVKIDTKGHPGNSDYALTSSADLRPHLHGDWERFDRLFGIEIPPDGAYHGTAVHDGAPASGYPGISVVRNLTVEERRTLEVPDALRPLSVLGCSVGRYYPPDETEGPRLEEIIEFQSYGLVTIDRGNDEIELWVGGAGDKVSIESGCHVTLYNLGAADAPLVTLHTGFKGPQPTTALAEAFGPPLLAYYEDEQVVLVLNRLYVNSAAHDVGVRLAGDLPDSREVRISRRGRLNLGRLLHARLSRDSAVVGQLARLGLRVEVATPTVTIPRPLAPSVAVAARLVDAASLGTAIHGYFGRQAADGGAAKAKGANGISSALAKAKDAKRGLIELKPVGAGKLQLVVEGTGDWVETAYRPALEAVNGGSVRIEVVYATDTTWAPRPAWTYSPARNGWERTYDKADPVGLANYENLGRGRGLHVDAVVVVTPDFTHAEITSGWLGRVPLVVVEKPLDALRENVADLTRAMADTPETAVLCVDHYQLYALPLADEIGRVETHLGGALARVDFFMTETRPIELGRERTLQYGLTSDLFPHLLALLAYFGDVKTIDEIEVHQAGRYEPLTARGKKNPAKVKPIPEYSTETYSAVKFTFLDHSGSNHRIPCRAIVGKGMGKEVKYAEFTGVNGNAVRIDFSQAPQAGAAYPWDCVSFLVPPDPPNASADKVEDAHDRGRTLGVLQGASSRLPLRRDRYQVILEDLVNGTDAGVAGLLLFSEGAAIVTALDRIWWAIQDARPWTDHPLGDLDPVKLAAGLGW